VLSGHLPHTPFPCAIPARPLAGFFPLWPVFKWTPEDLPANRHHVICEGALTTRQKHQSPLPGGPPPTFLRHSEFPLSISQHVSRFIGIIRKDLAQLIETQNGVVV